MNALRRGTIAHTLKFLVGVNTMLKSNAKIGSPLRILFLSRLIVIYQWLEEYKNSNTYCNELAEIITKKPQENDILAFSLFTKAINCCELGSIKDAYEWLEKGLVIFKNSWGDKIKT